MEKSPLTWDYLESGFAREVSGTCQPKHWEAWALPLGDTRMLPATVEPSARRFSDYSKVPFVEKKSGRQSARKSTFN